MNIQAILKQPSTILGLGTLAGTISAIVAHVLTHDTTVTAGIGGIAFAIVHMAMPDNSAAPSAVEKLAVDTITAAMQQRLAAALPALFTDAVGVVQAFQAPAVVPVHAVQIIPPVTAAAAPSASPVTA